MTTYLTLVPSTPETISAGRPPSYHPEIVQKICSRIETDGLAQAMAALLEGVDAATIALWKQEHPGFTLRLDQAWAEYRRARLEEIRVGSTQGGKSDWRAQAWLLEHAAEDPEKDAAATPGSGPALTPEHLVELQRRRAATLRQRAASARN